MALTASTRSITMFPREMKSKFPARIVRDFFGEKTLLQVPKVRPMPESKPCMRLT